MVDVPPKMLAGGGGGTMVALFGAVCAAVPVLLSRTPHGRVRHHRDDPAARGAALAGLLADLERASTQDWHLQPGGGLARAVPPPSPPDAYDYDPKDPAPTVGGATPLTPSLPAGPHDQRAVEARADVRSYTSDVLQEPCTVLGAVSVTLYAASSAPDPDFVARLVDVHPDGRAIGVADGIIRVSARESYPSPGIVTPVPPTPIEPDVVYAYTVDLWATGWAFLAGHRLRVDVTSSSHPRWDRNLNTGRSAFDSAVTAVARQRIFHDPDGPSRISLTVVEP